MLRAALECAALVLLLACSQQVRGGTWIFCCNDDSGRQVCGDILPTACYGRAYRIVGDSGRTLKTVEAPLTAEQRAQREAEERRRAEQDRLANEQRRKDQALLNTYGSEKDIEIMRTRAERDIAAAIKAADERIAEIRGRRKKFEEEAEFYRNRTLPADVAKGLRDADHEIRTQELIIEGKKKEREGMRQKYDEELRRFVELSKRPPGRP